MNQTVLDNSLSFISTQESFLTERCRACEKYGHVADCVSQDLPPVMYFNLAASLFSPQQTKIHSSCNSIEKQLLWHANLLGKNPHYIFQIIKNLITYSEHYICEEYAEHIENTLEKSDLHIARERNFICNMIEKLQKRNDNGMLTALKEYKGNYPRSLFDILMKNIYYARLFPLLSLIFLEKTTNDEGLYIKQLQPPVLLSRGNSLNTQNTRLTSSQASSQSEEGFSISSGIETDSFSFPNLNDSQKSDETVRSDTPFPSQYIHNILDDDDEPAVRDKEPVQRQLSLSFHDDSQSKSSGFWQQYDSIHSLRDSFFFSSQ